jgi:putative oxidoreductase
VRSPDSEAPTTTTFTALNMLRPVHAVDLALLVLRLNLAAVFLAHGFNHIYGGGKIAGTARWFDSLGMHPGRVHAWMASLTEVGSGALLVLGLLTPLAGAGVVGVMLVAWITNHRGNGFFIFRPGEGWEYVMTLTALGLAIAAVGPGHWSLDDAFGLLHYDQWKGLAVCAGAGGGGSLLLLATAWRPVPKPKAEAAA